MTTLQRLIAAQRAEAAYDEAFANYSQADRVAERARLRMVRAREKLAKSTGWTGHGIPRVVGKGVTTFVGGVAVELHATEVDVAISKMIMASERADDTKERRKQKAVAE